METLKVMLVYPSGFNIETKDIQLNQTELIGMMLSNKVGSEGNYFTIKDKIYEDTKDGYVITIILENQN
ncbi:hypothetical protein [Desulforamulus aeronauticus]|uniref:hypothetical protein n=1 Tax=Desulforamulus aeronauticus TaxID=53343 RepID=UPI001114B754|nr:hypothetical protein [Desulforamulus aeronauticus]